MSESVSQDVVIKDCLDLFYSALQLSRNSEFAESAKLFKEIVELFEVKSVSHAKYYNNTEDKLNFALLFDEVCDDCTLEQYTVLYKYRQLLLLRSIAVLHYFILVSTYKFVDSTVEVKSAIEFLVKYVEHGSRLNSHGTSTGISGMIPSVKLQLFHELQDTSSNNDGSTPVLHYSHEIILFYIIYELCHRSDQYSPIFYRIASTCNRSGSAVSKEKNRVKLNDPNCILRNSRCDMVGNGDNVSLIMPQEVQYPEYLLLLNKLNCNVLEVIFKCVLFNTTLIKATAEQIQLINYYYATHQAVIKQVDSLLDRMDIAYGTTTSSGSAVNNASNLAHYRIQHWKNDVMFQLVLLITLSSANSVMWDSLQVHLIQALMTSLEQLKLRASTSAAIGLSDTEPAPSLSIWLFIEPIYRYLADNYCNRFISISNVDYNDIPSSTQLIPVDGSNKSHQVSYVYHTLTPYQTNLKGVGIKYDEDNASISNSIVYYQLCIQSYMKCIDMLKTFSCDVSIAYPYPILEMISIQQFLSARTCVGNEKSDPVNKNVYIKHPLGIYCTNNVYYPCCHCAKQSVACPMEVTVLSIPSRIQRYYKDLMECQYQIGLCTSSYRVATDAYRTAIYNYQEYTDYCTILAVSIDSNVMLLLLDIKYHLAQCYFHMGRYADARVELEGVLTAYYNLKSTSKHVLTNRIIHIYTLMVLNDSRSGRIDDALASMKILESLPKGPSNVELGPLLSTPAGGGNIASPAMGQIAKLKRDVLELKRERDKAAEIKKQTAKPVEQCPILVKQSDERENVVVSNINATESVNHQVRGENPKVMNMVPDALNPSFAASALLDAKKVSVVPDSLEGIPLKYVDSNLYIAYTILIMSALLLGLAILYSLWIKYN